VCEALSAVEEADEDGDGLIENDGEDTTFDAWAMHGPSAYGGGLWLAALAAGAAMADLVGDAVEAERYRDLLRRGQEAYEELLWNGDYYDFDGSPGRQSGVCMAAQVVGPWYARACGLPPVIPADHMKSALQQIYELNVMQFENGEMGAVNGMYPDGSVDTSTMQSQEVWPGVTYALAAAMLYEGLYDEAWDTAKGIATMTYRDLGLWFGTPEAWNWEGNYRSFAYMRPLAIWAMQWAWQATAQEQAAPAKESAAQGGKTRSRKRSTANAQAEPKPAGGKKSRKAGGE
jgi:non-lysosomal glucosylceramidase